MSRAPHAPGTDLVEDIVGRIELAIVTGELRSGERLSEPALSEMFGASRGPLREAVRTLVGRRLVTRRPNAGVRVVDLSPDEIEHLLVMREALEGMAARHAAENMTLPELRLLRETAARLREGIAGGDVDSLYRGGEEHEFHRQIARASRNPFILDAICRDMFPLLRVIRFRISTLPARQSRIGEEHLSIVDALERRLPDEAERLMRRHIANGRDGLLRSLRAASA